MTATVQFLTGSATNVLMVPNAALRFRATPDMMAAAGLGQGRRQGVGNSTSANGTGLAGASTGAAGARGGFGGGSANGGGQRWSGAAGGQSPNGARPSMGLLWYVDKNGKPAVARVRTGLTDGQNTEITPRDSTTVAAGMQVIVGTNATPNAASASSGNPLQPQAGGRRGPGGF
jgi:HlyD family secretion protein